MTIVKNQKVQQFINTVLQQIEYKEIHEEIRAVLVSRINNLIGFHNLKATSEEDVIHKAILEMGDPMELGKKLAWLENLFSFSF